MIDLSADLGEGSQGEESIWPLISSANVACGGHYGDDATMRDSARLAALHGVRLGAHPSYPDRANFGRKSLAIAPAELRSSLVQQISALASIAPIHHVKPHGALYNDAHHDPSRAEVVVDAIIELDARLVIVASDRSEMAAAARRRGVKVIREAFGDRRYELDGSLVPRSVPGATLDVEEAAEQVETLAREGIVVTRDGTRLVLAFDTVCIHADMERALERLIAIRSRLTHLP